MKFGMGQSIRRVEDAQLIRGAGSYTADLIPEGALRAFVLRSPHAHADFEIRSVEAALNVKGVKAVLTAEDVADLGPIPCKAGIKSLDGKRIAGSSTREVLCSSRVRHVGDPIAFVVATTLDAARDGAEAIDVRWRPLPAVVGMNEAMKDGAPLLWPGSANNIAGRAAVGDKAKVDAIFAKAERVVALEIDNNRLVTNYMEPRAAIGSYDGKSKSYTLTLGSQGSHGIRDILCDDMMKLPHDKLRVITPEVGGGFGTKAFMFHEYPLCLVASRMLKKPVAWVQERGEHFISCAQGRDNHTRVEGALDAKGRIIAMRIANTANMGAYLSQYAPFIPYLAGMMTAGCYDIPAFYYEVTEVFTNTLPVDAYRGAGRPEAAYYTERFMDHCAHEIGMDAVKFRKMHFIKPKQMPYTTPVKRVIDSGEFAGHLDRALELVEVKGFRVRQRAAARRGKLRGLGFACYIEACGGGGPENAWTRIEKDGTVTVLVGSQNNGQGHKTAYAQLAARRFNVPPESVNVIQGDTQIVPKGSGTGGSRALPVGGAAVDEASVALVERLKGFAAKELEVGEGDLELVDAKVRVVGTDKAISFAAIAALPEAQGKLETDSEFTPAENTYPNGTHAVELEVDPDTGLVEIVNYVIVDDFGVALNPMMLEGQVHGGVAQGIGQALMEHTIYDRNGQLLTASFMDYGMPRAGTLPSYRFELRNIPCKTNPLGVKGAGEAGAIGSCPAVMNALVNALRPIGVDTIDMPATSDKVWQAIRAARVPG